MLKQFIQKYNLENKKLIIACSGGPDSIFLVNEFMNLVPRNNLVIAHFNHHLRGQESQRDEDFTRDFCLKNNLVFELGEGQIVEIAQENKIGIEEAARTARYEFLREIKQKYNADYIMTAHHIDDKIETFLLNVIRGTKLNGLVSIEEQNGDIIRPLLSHSKEEILEYLDSNNISYVHDSTNFEDIYHRNNLRLNVIPNFSKINNSYRKNIGDLMNYFSEMRDFVDSEISGILRKNYFEISDFLNLNKFLQKEFVRYIYEIQNKGTIGLSKGNIDEIIKFINGKGNYTIKEIKNLKLEKINGKVYLK